MTFPITRYSALVGLSALILTGAQAQTPVGRTTTTTKGVPGPKVVKKMSVVEWFDSIPKMRMDKPIESPKPKQKGDPKPKGANYIAKTYTLSQTPSEFVSMGEIPALWLGGIVSEKGVRSGGRAVHEVPIPPAMRAPLEISISSLGTDTSTIVKQPSKGDVNEAIGDLLNKAIKQRQSWGASGGLSEAYSFKYVENHNEQQTAIALGINARYMNAHVKEDLSAGKKSGLKTITVSFIERAFTVSARPGSRDKYKTADLWVTPAFTMDVINKLVGDDDISRFDNVPCYVSSVTYGRRLIFNLTSRFSHSEMKNALEVGFGGKKVGGDVKLSVGKVLNDGETTITVAGQGGPGPDQISDLLLKGNLKAYFSAKPSPGSLVPISYAINSVVGNDPVVVLQTDEYTDIQYIGNAPGRRYQLTAYLRIDSKPEVGNRAGEMYGELRMEGEPVWAWTRENNGRSAQARRSGDMIDLLTKQGEPYTDTAAKTPGMVGAPFTMNCYEEQRPIYKLDLFVKDADSSQQRRLHGRLSLHDQPPRDL
ncbi:MAG: thiol-activated cytolysin family protein [Armatimonas sp.]